MGDPVDILKDVGLNLATGGLYSVGKAVSKTVQTGNPIHLLAQGFDVGLAGLGNDLATRLGGPKAGIAFNLAGLGIGLAGASGAFSGLPGFAPGGAAPLVATPTGAIPVSSGAMESATVADIAGATLTGPVGAVAAPAAAAPGATGGLANLAGLPGGTVAASTLLPAVSQAAPETAGYLGELRSMAPALNSMPTKGWWESLSPGAQTAVITGAFAGGQMVTGAMQGLFAGISAQKKLELEQLIANRTEAQIQYRNRNNQYAPLLTFKTQPGLINTPTA